MSEIGKRVIAVCSADAEVIKIYGYGVYEGDHVPPTGWMHEANISNPKIQLADGGVIWGYQCWWGDESRKDEILGGRKVEVVPLPPMRGLRRDADE